MDDHDSCIEIATWLKKLEPTVMQNALDHKEDEDFISFALGLPDCSLFPISSLQQAEKNIAKYHHEQYLQYAIPSMKLKKQIVKLMLKRGAVCKEEDIFLTSGAQQGIYLLSKLLLNSSDNVLVENYAYPGFMQAISEYKPRILTVNTNLSTGIDIMDVEKKIKTQPGLLYLVTDGSNPQSVSISLEKREALVDLAKQYKVPIIEDDPYGFLQYNDNLLPSLRSFDDNWILYVGTFSKIFAPSFRTGWVVLPHRFHKYLSYLKEAIDINTFRYTQLLLSEFIENLDFDNHIDYLCSVYKGKRDLMFQEISKNFPKDVEVYIPQCGFFLWVKLPIYIDMERLTKLCHQKYKVTFILGKNFLVADSGSQNNYIRLNYSSASQENIVDGIGRMGEALMELTSKSSSNIKENIISCQ